MNIPDRFYRLYSSIPFSELIRSSANYRLPRKTAALALVGLSFILLGSCSSLRSHYSMVPIQEAGWQVSENSAIYRTEDFQVRINVPLSGTWQHSMGPCLIPVLPVTRDLPRPLEVWIEFETSPGSRIDLKKDEWLASLRAQEFGETFPDDYQIESKVASAYEETTETGGTRFKLFFDRYDNEFVDFNLKGTIYLNGKIVPLPLLSFERESDLDYTPFTTKILDLL
ncbi:MAG: hypothetical protein RH862_04600 [Leptospiraceae bacterium]